MKNDKDRGIFTKNKIANQSISFTRKAKSLNYLLSIKPITVILLVQPKLNNLNQKVKNSRLFILEEKDNYPDNKMFKMVGLVETVPKHYPH